MKHRGWAESEPPLWSEFLFGMIGGALAFYNFIGWVFISWGLNVTVTLVICGGVGLLLGIVLVKEGIRERRKRGKENNG